MKYINGYTYKKVMEKIKKYNNGRRAVKPGTKDECQYITDDYNRCAIGCFIPDGHNAFDYNLPAHGLLCHFPDLKAYMPVDDIFTFQRLHDGATENVHDIISKYLKENCN